MKIALVTTGVRDLTSEKIYYLKSLLPHVSFSVSPDIDFDAEMIIGYPKPVEELGLNSFSHLKVIQLLSVGYDTLDLFYLHKRSIRLFTAHQTTSAAISEFVIGQILNVNYDLSFYTEKQNKKEWHPRYKAVGLSGSKALILGTGGIGSALAERLSAFGVSVTGFRQKEAIPPHFTAIYTDIEKVKEHLGEFDYVICALPLTRATAELIDYPWFLNMKRSAVFINVSRGHVVKEVELELALQAGCIRAAILDVFQEEPLPRKSILWELPNVYITPHIAYYNNQTIDNIITLLVHNINSYLAGEKILGEIIL